MVASERDGDAAGRAREEAVAESDVRADAISASEERNTCPCGATATRQIGRRSLPLLPRHPLIAPRPSRRWHRRACAAARHFVAKLPPLFVPPLLVAG